MEATSSRPSSPASVGRRPQSAASILNTHHLFQVFLRLRPPHSSSQGVQFLSTIPGQSHVYVTPPEKNRFRVIEKFSFTEIFGPESTQRDIFEGTVLPLLQDTVKGRDTLLATLGVTGSGKTHTILGNHEQRGMTQLSLDVLFRSIGDQMVDVSSPMTHNVSLR